MEYIASNSLGAWALEGDHTQHLHRSQEMWLMYKNACFPVYIWVPLVWQESRPTTASLNKDRHWQRPYLLCLQLPSQIRGALEFMSISRVLPPIDYFSISHSNNPFYRIYYKSSIKWWHTFHEKWHNLNEKWHKLNYIWQTQYFQPKSMKNGTI